MAFVTWVDDSGARKVVGVFRTQAEANTSAGSSGALNAHTGSVNDNVEPGDFINSAGSLLTTVPAAVRRAAAEIDWKSRISNAYLAGYFDEPHWRYEPGLDENDDARQAGTRYRYHQAALAWQVAVGGTLTSLAENNRNQLLEHLVEEISRPAFRRFLDASKAIRDGWVNIATSDGSAIHTDLVTSSGTERTSDLTAPTPFSVTILPGFKNLLEDG